jgi:hypothetical protein
MGYEPIDAEYESQMEAVYNGVLEEYFRSDSYHEDISRSIDEFINERQKSFYVMNSTVAEPAFNLLTEARELFVLDHYGAAQVMAGAAAEVTLGEALLKPMVYGFVHSDTVAPMLVKIVKDTKQLYRFEPLIIGIVSQFSGLSLTEATDGSKKSLWEFVKSVARQRNEVLHGEGLVNVTREQADEAISVATTLLETVFPALLKNLGLHVHGIKICGDSH